MILQERNKVHFKQLSFNNSQFPETRSFQCFKYGTGILVAMLYLSYFVYLIFQVIDDQPLIQTSYEYVDKLSIPGMFNLK